MIAAREQTGGNDDQADNLLAQLYAAPTKLKPPVAISIMPHPRELGYFVMVDEDLRIVGLFGAEVAVATGWAVTT
jgi:hypothetical protein